MNGANNISSILKKKVLGFFILKDEEKEIKMEASSKCHRGAKVEKV